ncbi:recombinase family protein [Pseudoxanthomonas mexicana]|uniref:recombinase family protein n=1 Tax=Pseudoxanthomonas mexicana TaxID=128785 RepID=UPI0028A6CB3C|nr:recombinase family protein [Pseudoxanthomonas mexicana]
MAAKSTPAVAYLRTSSAANVGQDKDSHKRQQEAIEAYARTAGLAVREPPFYDAAVSGADPIESREGFASLLAFLAEHPEVRTILVESASRFARDLIVQETGYRMLQARGISLVAVDSPESFLDDTPTAVLIRQVLGAVSEFEKAMTVAKLRGARDRKRAITGKCEGRKSMAEARPEVVSAARRMHRVNPSTGKRRSAPEIAAALAEQGYLTATGRPFRPTAVRRMLGLEKPRRMA